MAKRRLQSTMIVEDSFDENIMMAAGQSVPMSHDNFLSQIEEETVDKTFEMGNIEAYTYKIHEEVPKNKENRFEAH